MILFRLFLFHRKNSISFLLNLPIPVCWIFSFSLQCLFILISLEKFLYFLLSQYFSLIFVLLLRYFLNIVGKMRYISNPRILSISFLLSSQINLFGSENKANDSNRKEKYRDILEKHTFMVYFLM